MNYGHNNPSIKKKLIEYLVEDNIVHSLDFYTLSKYEFLEDFQNLILLPRQLNYKVQFTGPTGTNAVEAALKLARNYTKRKNIAYFNSSFHGVTLGSLSVTSNQEKRNASGIPLTFSLPLPYDGDSNSGINSVSDIDNFFATLKTEDKPAAVILETVQAEGGVRIASIEWLTSLSHVLNKHGILLIVDDIQVGCGRVGTFFSFEEANINPDIMPFNGSIRPSAVILAPEADSGDATGAGLACLTVGRFKTWDRPSAARPKTTATAPPTIHFPVGVNNAFSPTVISSCKPQIVL